MSKCVIWSPTIHKNESKMEETSAYIIISLLVDQPAFDPASDKKPGMLERYIFVPKVRRSREGW